ncbi:hypothetical protein FCN77_16265 [Arthrobacter sp. 24S4-2]|uniref:hypothetical protein n=1 Tax=Arthrobacter sp. 24S4-2 TaxID=2575374 RepID=UPI0010C7BE55|nr:hypothetical protein [Arthrobacter sp. 24S4-2]QCO98969.1 hypothetical protein FCN77_16265 [Arthrobacter sp. 24S4-2]
MAHSIMNIKTADVTLDAISYADAITSVKLTAASEDTTWVPVSGVTQTQTGILKWTAELEFGQDLTANSTLQAKLLALHGQVKTLVVKPTGTATQSITVSVTVKAPAEFGGAVGVATSNASLPVNGQPTFVYGV